jgi:hypothetical protein
MKRAPVTIMPTANPIPSQDLGLPLVIPFLRKPIISRLAEIV